MLKASMTMVVALLSCASALSQQAPRNAGGDSAERNASGSLRQIIPGHYAYTSGTFNSGVIATSEGVVVLDALNSAAVGRAERQAIANTIEAPVRVLVSST